MPDHQTTGVASTSDTHCQPSNCSGGTMPSRTTGTASTAATMSRRRSATEWSTASASGSGSLAPYPVFFTTSIRWSIEMSAGTMTCAFSVA